MPIDPASLVLSGIGTAVNTTITLVKFVHELKSTPTDVKTCLDLVSRVDEDIQYAIVLREKHIKHLSSTPDDLKRLDRIISGANESILDVGRLLEGCRREAHGGQVPMAGRIKWVMGDSTAFSRRTANLQQQHAAINVEIAFLRNMEALQPVKDLLISNTTFENMELLSMGRRKSSSKLSAYCDIDLIDLKPPPEYAPPVPPHDLDELMSPGFMTNQCYETYELCGDQAFAHGALEEYGGVEQSLTQGNDLEDEDPEAAFYRELRQQEDERRERIAARLGNG